MGNRICARRRRAGTRGNPLRLVTVAARYREADRWGCPRMINDLWYKNAVIYCLSVGTYMDANGDGVGDFKGLMRRLDYLHGLGITAIWLMPFQPSPGKDDGYDIADYYGVDPRYGTLGDFVEFTHGCRAARHPRHHRSRRQSHLRCSIPGFATRAAIPDSHYRDWYVWADKKPRQRRQGHGVSRRAEIDLDARQGSQAPGTSIASTISSPTSTPRTRTCRPRSSRSWASGSSSASPASAWTRCRS